ncbi:MAG: two-component sensor histidine kinase, partial [Paracoccaceae bacterium]|nr:two-component sensor histidine kinase [Paracoccaceae bacterium]
MNTQWLKRYVPRSLYGRAALILLVPVVTLQLVVSVVFIQRHFEDVTRQMTEIFSIDLAFILSEIAAAESSDDAQARVGDLALALLVKATLPADDPPAQILQRRFYDLSGRIVILTLAERLPDL